ncbi:MAG: hypothetical protein JNL11_20690 [Bdellovibrionaceae bacterium]|nr:hypothetical protein [Pseudobdellovibrionaceae bacterium]
MKLVVLFFMASLLATVSATAQDYSQLGWPRTLTELYKQLEAKEKNFFIIISRLPSQPIDFRTNQGMHDSLNSIAFQKNYHPGHKMMGWKCRINGAPFETMLGMSGETTDQHEVLLENGWGLTSLLATFKDGFIQTPEELENRFEFFMEENKMADDEGKKRPIFLVATVIEISEVDCENLVNESFEFFSHPNNPAENFSLILSPDKYEGGGCGSFVAHFMKQITSLKPLIPFFRRQLRLPNYLFGTGTALPDDVEIPDRIKQIASPGPVSKLKLITSLWNSSTSSNLSVEILDPEHVVFWQKLFFETYFDRNSWTKEKKSFNKLVARGVWQRTEDTALSENGANVYIPIDRNYDPRLEAIYRLQSQLVENMKLTYFTFSNFPGMILEKK